MRNSILGTLAACAAASIWASPAAAAASSSAYAVGVNQTVTAPNLANVNVSVGPLAATSGTAPPSYNNSASVASLDQTAALNTTGMLAPVVVNENLGATALSSNSQGTTSGAQATATIANGAVTVGTAGLPTSLFNLVTTTIQSFSQANAGGVSGSTTIEGLNLTGSIFGASTYAILSSTPSPNTILFSGLGLTITLNEQILSGTTGITTNAIHINFNNFAAGTGLTNGDIILGHTQASFSPEGAVPEPSTWAMMLLGFAGIGLTLRRSRKSLKPAFQTS
jgi:hypothetical protein